MFLYILIVWTVAANLVRFYLMCSTLVLIYIVMQLMNWFTF